tara:strand:- start:131 stop:1951 length:1821 start_codon:yes stop_codon:yes gene_type:complete
MERLAAKKRKGILSRMPKESNEDILVGLKKAELAAGGRKATQADVESVNEELELANTQDKLDARKPAGKLKARPDLKLEGLKSSTDIVQEAKKKEADTGDLATIQNIMREHRREEALQNPESLTPAVREAMQEHMKQEGDRYRAALQPKKGFEEDYDADVKFQEEEYGGGSIRREMELDEIRGPRDSETGVREAALGEDSAEYDKQYAKLQKENPNMSETELQDAAIKAIRSLQARDAEFAAKDFKTVDYGDEMENEVRRKRLAEEEAARKAAQDSRLRAGSGARKQLTPQERAARVAMQMERDKQERPIPEVDTVDYTRTSEQEEAEFSPLLDGPEQPALEELGESETSFEPGESEVTEQEVEDAAIEREYEARPKQSGMSRVSPKSQEEREQYARYKPEVKQVSEAKIIKPATEALDNIYLTPNNQEATAENLDTFLTKTRLGYSVLGGAGQSALDSLTARNDYQYYKTLPLFMKRNLDAEALKAIEFFDEFNRSRGEPSLSSFNELLLQPGQKSQMRGRFLQRIARAKGQLQDRLRSNSYEQSEELPPEFRTGQYLPAVDIFGLTEYEGRGTPAYSKDVPLEAQEDVYQESEMEDLIASSAGE